MLAGAVGDALGAPVEFMSLQQIRDEFGQKGVTDYQPAYGRKGAVTDDTQMTLFTSEGLILSRVRKEYNGPDMIPTAVYHAYLRWLSTQQMVRKESLIKNYGTCAVVDGMLTAHPELFSQRAPGNSCLSALMSGRMGTMEDPINDSKGCGGVMRMAPVGLFCNDPAEAFDIGCRCAAITHGHPSGYLAAGFLAALIRAVLSGDSLTHAVPQSIEILKQASHNGEVLNAVTHACDLSRSSLPAVDAVGRLGEGWVAEEALAIGLYCALTAGGDFARGVLTAVNHGGDSDSTGAVAGNIIGALYGSEVIPGIWLKQLELRDIIEEIAEDLYNCAVGLNER